MTKLESNVVITDNDDRDSATLPTSTVRFNQELDAQIVSQEPRDLDAPWWQRKFFATAWSTVKQWFQ